MESPQPDEGGARTCNGKPDQRRNDEWSRHNKFKDCFVPRNDTKLRKMERSEQTGVLFALQKTKLRKLERSEQTGVLFALQKTKLRKLERSEQTVVLFAL